VIDPLRMATARIGDRLDALVTQAVVALAAVALCLLGVISLAVAACVALAAVWGVPLAALTTGAVLILIALIAWLLVVDGGARRRSRPAPKPDLGGETAAAGAAQLGAALAAGVQARPKEAALIALIGGLIAGSSPELRRGLERLID